MIPKSFPATAAPDTTAVEHAPSADAQALHAEFEAVWGNPKGWRALSVGMEVQGDQRKLHLVRAKAWYDGRPHYLK